MASVSITTSELLKGSDIDYTFRLSLRNFPNERTNSCVADRRIVPVAREFGSGRNSSFEIVLRESHLPTSGSLPITELATSFSSGSCATPSQKSDLSRPSHCSRSVCDSSVVGNVTTGSCFRKHTLHSDRRRRARKQLDTTRYTPPTYYSSTNANALAWPPTLPDKKCNHQ